MSYMICALDGCMKREASEIELAYLAGVLDSDGCIGCYIPKGKISSIRINVMFAGQDYELMKFIDEIFYGHISSNNGCYQWSSKNHRLILTALLPYLRLKKPQALLALSYLDSEFFGKKGQEALEFPKSIYKESLSLNSRFKNGAWKVTK